LHHSHPIRAGIKLHFHLVQGVGRGIEPPSKSSNEEKPSYFSGWLPTVKICYVEFAQNRNVFGTPQKLYSVPNVPHNGGPIRRYAGIMGCVSSRLVKWRT